MYQIISETVYLEGTVYQTYGIISPAGQKTPDITPQKPLLLAFIQKLNNGQASEIHFPELIEDFLN